MLEKSRKFKDRFDELTRLVVLPEVIADNREWQKLAKERSGLEEIADAHDKLEKTVNEIENLTKLLKSETDAEMKAMYNEELYDLKASKIEQEEEVKFLMLPKDEDDDKNVIIEVRSAAGGEESSLFCSALTKMYTRYAERCNWKTEVLDLTETELGGIKEITFLIKGKGAYSKLKFESGVHRVQRVPETESQGRIHTSTSTVAVLPEVEEVGFEIDEKDLRVDTYRSGGAGGQHVNKTESAVRMTHLPTGIVVACQDERSQIKNRERAMKILKSKLYDYYKTQKESEYKEQRKNQVGTGDRSEKIRTYNYPQDRVTDHRINFSQSNLPGFLDGNLEELINELIRKNRELMLGVEE